MDLPEHSAITLRVIRTYDSSCTQYRLKDIKSLTNKSAKRTFELIHLIKNSLFSRFG